MLFRNVTAHLSLVARPTSVWPADVESQKDEDVLNMSLCFTWSFLCLCFCAFVIVYRASDLPCLSSSHVSPVHILIRVHLPPFLLFPPAGIFSFLLGAKKARQLKWKQVADRQTRTRQITFPDRLHTSISNLINFLCFMFSLHYKISFPVIRPSLADAFLRSKYTN